MPHGRKNEERVSRLQKEPKIRKLDIFVENICTEGGAVLEKPLKKCAAAAVIKNPYAGVYTEDLTELMEYGAFLGDYLTRKAVEAMGIPGAEGHSFGRAPGLRFRRDPIRKEDRGGRRHIGCPAAV